MAVVKAEYLVAKDSESGEEQNVKFVPPAPSDGDLGGISKEDSEQITKNKNDIADIRKTLWDKILDKLTSAVVERLNTTNKTVIGALNELNSKALKPFYSGYISNTPLTIKLSIGLYFITTYRSGGYKISSLSVLNIQIDNGSFLETLVKGENYDATVKMDCTENGLSANYKIKLSGNCAIEIYKVCQ